MKSMYWRQLIVRLAAKVLDEVGEKQLASQLRGLDLPLLDGGGLYIAEQCWPHITVDQRHGRFQSIPKPSSGQMVLAEIPAELWGDK